jgi:zinc/manganese transport system substrate-binding protein
MRRDRRFCVLGLAATGVAGTCPTGIHFALADGRIQVVATFSILSDIVANIGGDRIALRTLVGPNGDGHVYQPNPADARAVGSARLVFANGLKFEGWIGRLVRASASKAEFIEVARDINTIVVPEDAPGVDHGDHSHAGDIDPHAWQSVPNVKIFTAVICEALIRADPAGQSAYEANAYRYLGQLTRLDQDIRDTIASIPADRRTAITSHGAFGYFEKAYGIRFVAPQGVSTEAEATARDVARIIQQIRREKIAALFMQNISDQRLLKRIAEETGATIGGVLYSDALSAADGPASTCESACKIDPLKPGIGVQN